MGAGNAARRNAKKERIMFGHRGQPAAAHMVYCKRRTAASSADAVSGVKL
jgi:hypothetical protein